MLIIEVFRSLGENLAVIADFFRYTWFVVLPPTLYWIFRYVWLDFMNGEYIGGTRFELIEIIPPRNVEMSPQPMELIFAGIQGIYSTPSTYEELCLGSFTLPFSFELAGIDGKVHFYIYYPAHFRDLLRSHIYAQYPDVEILDVHEDYTRQIPAVVPNKDWELWGTDLELVAPDPVPIKTWKYFEEDVTGKMIDPLSGLIEVMGRTRKGENIWLQIIAVPQKETWYNTGRAYAEELKGRATKPQKGLLGRIVSKLTEPLIGGGGDTSASGEEQPLEFRLSPMEKKVLEAVEENIGRYVFQVKMRFIYVAHKSVFDKPSSVSGFFGAMKQFADFNLNSLKPHDRSKTQAFYLFRKTRLRYLQRKILDRYRKRKTTGHKFYLSDRELATLYHMPDMSVVAPAMARSGATQAGAPPNLPT